MIVVDLGCVTWGAEESVERLIERFRPRLLVGFDPALPVVRDEGYESNGTEVLTLAQAAWTFDGFVGFRLDGPRGYAYEFEAGVVPCFDLAAYIRHLATFNRGEEIVLKLDVEGGEYELLPHLHRDGADEFLKLALVEWHDDATVGLRCPVEEWV